MYDKIINFAKRMSNASSEVTMMSFIINVGLGALRHLGSAIIDGCVYFALISFKLRQLNQKFRSKVNLAVMKLREKGMHCTLW